MSVQLISGSYCTTNRCFRVFLKKLSADFIGISIYSLEMEFLGRDKYAAENGLGS